jgi:hypothetical protein
MKKLIALLTVFVLMGAFTACNKNNSNDSKKSRVTKTVTKTTTIETTQTTNATSATEITTTQKPTLETAKTIPPTEKTPNLTETPTTTAISETEETETEYELLNDVAGNVCINAQVVAMNCIGEDIEIGGIYYSNDNSEFSQKLNASLSGILFAEGKITDFTNGWAVAISTNGTDNINPGTVLGAVVAGENNIYGTYPSPASSENTYPDIETAIKATVAYFLNKPNIIHNS